jgi:hypothetical protein
MTKNTLNALVTYLTAHDIPELADATAELVAEQTKNIEKANANRELYDKSHDIVMAVIDDTPRTVAEIFDACTGLPADFTKSKLQYALRAMWASEVNKIENTKGPNQYTKA